MGFRLREVGVNLTVGVIHRLVGFLALKCSTISADDMCYSDKVCTTASRIDAALDPLPIFPGATAAFCPVIFKLCWRFDGWEWCQAAASIACLFVPHPAVRKYAHLLQLI